MLRQILAVCCAQEIGCDFLPRRCPCPWNIVRVVLFATAIVIGCAFSQEVSAQQVVVFDTPGTGSFTVPANVSALRVEVWGGGGGGGAASRGAFSGGESAGGGGGGAYASRTIQVSAGQAFSYFVGNGGSSTNAGGNSWFGSTSLLLARGGIGVNTNSGTGGSGGSAAGSVGDVVFGGGRGANASGGDGGGGGGSAGVSAAGNNGSGRAGGSVVTGGGAGGEGSSGGSGTAGSAPGGGGGGAACRFLVCLSAGGGSGAPGQIRITYTIEYPKPDICFDEDFSGGALAPDDWATSVSRGSFRPGIVQGRLRLTEAVGNQATAVSFQRLFPGADNLIQVEFDYYAYGGSGADGIAVVFSDASVTPQAGGYGGSLGYAQEPNGSGGFAGGWLGIGIDEFGNFSNDSEGREGGNNGATPDSVTVRGAADLDYRYIAFSGRLSPGIDATGSNNAHRYRITIDSRGNNPVLIVERDTTGSGNNFRDIIEVTLTGQQADVPENLFFSITGSTGGSTNIHELDGLEICADKVGEVEERVHHFEIDHSGTGLTCQPETITIRACDNESCTQTFNDPVEVTMAPPGWLGGDTFTFSGGVATRPLAITSPGTVTLGVSRSDPGTVAFSRTLCRIGTGNLAADQCDLTFFDSGFDISVPDHISDTGVTATIAAVRKDDTNESCVPAFENVTKEVALWSTYVNPNSGTRALFADGDALPTSAGGTESLNFNGDGVATVGLRYPDVGRMRLNARYEGAGDDEGLVMIGDGEFVARPDHFQLTIPGNPAATTVADGNAFVAAGEEFEISVSSINASGDITPNFGRETPAEGVSLESALVAPATGDDPLLSGVFGDFGRDCNNDPATGGMACGQFKWPEVGIISITPSLTSGLYLNFEDVEGNAVSHVGRFIPDRFNVTVTENGEIEPFCESSTAFAYTGQTFNWQSGTEPWLTVEALNADGAVTRNYTLGDFKRLSADGFVRTPGAADESSVDANGNPFPVTTNLDTPTLTTIDRGRMQYLFASSDEIVYDKTPQTKVVPFEPAYRIELTELEDADGVSSLQVPLDVVPNLDFELRYGRLQMENVYGPETSNLAMPFRVEHYTNAGFVQNTADSCWRYNTGDAALDQSGLSGGTTSVLAVSDTLVGGTQEAGKEIILAAPGEGSRGDVQVGFPVPVWLTGDYDNDGVLENPSALATFGVYRGNDRIIYWREVEN